MVIMENMLIRRQSLVEIKEIYDGMFACHFPAGEIKPFERIKETYENGEYMAYGLYEHAEDKECLAYAWMCTAPSQDWILLDYYAVTEKLRGKGLGSRFLQKILKDCTQGAPVIIEVEDPDKPGDDPGISPEEEKKKRLRRIAFYLRNGAKETELHACVLQVNYRIMVFLDQSSDRNDQERNEKADAQNVVPFDRESLKKAYCYYYSHVLGNVEIG